MNTGKSKITVHMGTCGIAAGAKNIMSTLQKGLKEKDISDVILTHSGCAGLCSKEPMITVELQGKSPVKYIDLTPEKVDKILSEHIIEGKVVEDYALPENSEFFAHQTLIVLRNRGLIDPENIDDYIARDGYKALTKALTEMTPEDIIDEIKDSGLRGRGGAGFPTGLKWEFCKNAPGEVKYIICNADEGDPGAYMDRSVIESDPHSLLEGMLIGARAIGAKEGYIYIRSEYPLATRTLEIAISQAKEYGFIGENILDTDFCFDFYIKKGAGAFVCGEETSLIASIEGKPPEPRQKPPFPAQSGLWGKPTNINNVETWANVPPIINRGAEWFASIGSENSKGTKVFSLVGKINNTGLVEVPMGTPLRKIIYDIGGGIPGNKKLKAVQTGGPSGGCIPASLIDLPVDYENLTEAGSIMGSGGMIVMDETTCVVDIAKYFIAFTNDESCGKCVSCREGSSALLGILERISRGEGKEEDIELLEELCIAIKEASMCGLGQTLPNPVLSTLKYFKDEYIEHVKYKRCPAAVCNQIISSPCQHTCPINQDVTCYIGFIAQEKFDEAINIIRKENPLPSICGRVCTHPCQTKCRAGEGDGEPIAIRMLKRFAADYERNAKVPFEIETKEKKGKKVAIIGSGPAGLSCGYFLAIEGYDVMIFESLPVVGGMLATGIPEYRLPKDILEYEIDVIKKVGIEIKTNITVGKDISLGEIRKDYDAIFIATGAHKGLKLDIPGEESEDVIDGVTFLRNVNLNQEFEIGEKTAVIGGGNAAIDAARTAKRLGKDVTIYYRRTKNEMPAIAEEVDEAINEGVEIEYLVAPVRIISSNNKLTCVEFQKMRLSDMDETGRPIPVPIDGSEFSVEIDTLIIAISQRPDIGDYIIQENEENSIDNIEFEFTKSGTIEVDQETLYTGVEGIFAGGDVIRGPDSVIWAISDGKIAASMIDKYLKGKPVMREYEVTRPALDVEAIELTEEEIQKIQKPKFPILPVDERELNFNEVELSFTKEMAVMEAKRCYRCDLDAKKADEQL